MSGRNSIMKVFQGCTFILGRQVNVCVATTSQKRAGEICGVSERYVREFCSVTGNSAQVEAATSNPHVMMVATRLFPNRADEYITASDFQAARVSK